MVSFAKKWIGALLLFTIIAVFQFISGGLASQTSNISSFQAAEQEYEPHTPISIMNNQDFIVQGWPGNGTVDEPYVLEDFEIECDDETGIFIANTTVFFEISNCRLFAADSGGAFRLINITDGEVKSCVSENCYWAIWNSSWCSIESNDVSGHADFALWGCTNCSVVGNSFVSVAWTGVAFDTCTDCHFAQNFVAGCDSEGIWLLRGMNCSIEENEFAENTIGIGLVGSNDTFISHNNIHDNVHYGVQLYACGDTHLVGNTFQNDGVVLHFWDWGWNGHQISGRDFVTADYVFQDNTVNGKLLGFFDDLDGNTIDGALYGQVILLNCSNLAIDHGTIANSSCGVQILFSDNCTVTHTTIANTSTGVQILSSDNCSVMYTTIADCSETGVAVEESNCTRVLDCVFSNNVDSGLYFAHSYGALVAYSSVSGSRQGLALWSSGLCTVLNNTLSLNTWGAHLYHASNCTLVNNTVVYNKIGVFLDNDCDNNMIYGNSIGWNDMNNALSYNTNNQWDDGVSRGNRWSDYSGFGVYEINNMEVDRFPELLAGPFPYVELGLISMSVLGGVIIVFALVRAVKSRRVSEQL